MFSMQMYAALNNAFSAILKFVKDTSLTVKDDPKLLDEPKTR